MARAASLPSLGLTPFGGGGSSFDAFSIGAAKSEKAYLAFRKVEVEWEAGRVSDSALLAALQTYAGTIKAGTSERVSIDARVSAYTERFERNVIEAGIRAGTKTNEDLLAFDRSKLAGLNTSSEEYLQRLNAINSTQNEIFNDLQDEQQEKWDKGLITTAQLLNWYKGLRDDLLADNPDLAENVTNAVDQLELRAVDERDSRMMSDYSSGKVAPGDFIVYAQAARGRYEKGTSQFREWDERLDEAKDRAIEDSILYRYDLSQRYAQLEKFVKDHGKAPTGGVSTSTSKRTVWNGERWVTRTSTTNTPYGPSPSEQKAWAKLQVEVNDAKREMAQIAKKMDRQAGGWVSTDDAIGYYQKMKNRYAPGSSEWYAVQAKLDGLNSQKHAEAVMAKQGIRISYPRVSSERRELGSGGSGVWGPAKGGGRGGDGKDRKDGKGDRRRDAAGGDDDIDVDTFMRALAKVESGGRYDAVNKSSGAYGKYQIMPANWPGWAQKFLGDKNAKPTPENQEAVARAKLKALHRWLGDWRAVAHWWLTGGSDKQGHRDPSTWSSSSKAYVDKVFGKLGKGPTSRVVATGGGGARQFYSGAGAGGGQYAASPMRSGGGGATLSAGGRDGGGRGDRQGKGKGDGGGRADEEDRGRLRNPLNFPRGYDGRQFEDFYSAFLDAWQSGEDTFVDYGRGRPVAYFIPVDPDNRIDLMEELDERRVGYYIEKSRAYLNPNGSPTSSSIYATQQANNAIVDAAENLATGLSFQGDLRKRTGPVSKSASRTDAAAYPEYEMNRDVDSLAEAPRRAAKVRNPLAKGIRLAEQLDQQLAQLAAGSKRAYENGDFGLAYALNQRAVQLVATAKPTLDTYLMSASQRVRGITQAGGTVPSITTQDFDELERQIAELGGRDTTGRDKALADLDEVATDLQKILKLDPDGEPVRSADRSFVLRDNVNLIWKNGKLEIDTAASAVGWVSPTDRGSGKPMVQLGGIKLGTGVRGNVKSEYQIGVVGFIGGDESYPIQGKIVSGVDANGNPVQWAEDPINGGWYDIGAQPLNVKVPTGFKAVTGAGGSGMIDYQFRAGNGDFRLVFDKADGKYVLMEQPAGGLFNGPAEWQPVGKIGGGKNEDLRAILDEAGWKIDMTGRQGDDRMFSNLAGPVIGLKGAEWSTFLNGDNKGTRAGAATNGAAPGWGVGRATWGAGVQPTKTVSNSLRNVGRIERKTEPQTERGGVIRYGPDGIPVKPSTAPKPRKTSTQPRRPESRTTTAPRPKATLSETRDSQPSRRVGTIKRVAKPPVKRVGTVSRAERTMI